MLLNEMIIGTITNFSGTTTPDKNGKMPVMVQCIAGKMPNRNTLSGTVAERAGFEVGKTYLINIRQQGVDELFGEDFNFLKVQEITNPLDVIKAKKELGEPQLIFIERSQDWDQKYERKSDAIEGNRTLRIKEGKYRTNIPTSVTNHENAIDVEDGTSVNSGSTVLKA